jgi:hypothetical protein
MIDVFDLGKQHFKVNLHTHTTNSDGGYAPQAIVDLYRDKGYDALALTDHRFSNKISALESGDMTLISGIETHPTGPRGILLHFVGLGLPEDFADLSALPFQKCVDAINTAGGLCFLAHPYWSGLILDDMLQFDGFLGVEVYNTSCIDVGREFSEAHWDQLLEHRPEATAIAVDDTHGSQHLFGGWTMICADDKQPQSLLAALRKGKFHASTGPEIFKFDVNFETRRVYAEFSPVKKATVMSKASSGICLKALNHSSAKNVESGFIEKDGEKREFFNFSIPEGMPYFRCEITDENGGKAWTNPVVLSDDA